jgi:hypothetical protein
VSSTTGTADHFLASEIISYDQVNIRSIPEAQLDPNDFLFPSQSEIFPIWEYLFALDFCVIVFICKMRIALAAEEPGIDLR